MCGAMPRYGSISCEGNGNTTRSVAACVSPSSAARKNDTSAQVCSRSPSLGDTYSTTPCGFACAAAATKSAFAESVSPETMRAGTSIPLRVTAVLRRARRFSEVEVATVSRRAFSKARQTSSVSNRRQSFQPTMAERRTRDQKTTAGLLHGSDLPDDGARRLAGLEGDPEDPPAACLDDIASHDRVRGPVGALDEHIGLNRRDQVVRCLLVEDDDAVDTGESLEHLRPLGLRRDWTLRPLVGANRPVGVEADNQRVAEGPGLLQVAEVADVQQIEHAVGEDDRLAGGAESCHEIDSAFPRHASRSFV